ncbi:hypothetical protein [Mycobacterium sp.]|uniref:hypothetical protein n=1 Tax=Mycobacterium sp. TaxID=1785 RepID=UPI003F995275
MARVLRPPDLAPPVEVLKLIGTPRVEETDAQSYDVYLPLCRKLTAGEQDASAALGVAAKSPAGWVHVADDQKHLVVAQTTIEKVGQHQDSFKEIVSRIAAEGEEYRKHAAEAQRSADDKEGARQAERTRREEAAKTIKFD